MYFLFVIHLNTIVWTLWSALLLWGGQLAHKLSTAIHGSYLLLNEQMVCHFYLPEINLLRLSLWSLLPFFLYMKFSMTLCSTSFIYSLPAQLLLIVPFIALHKSFTCLFFCHAVSLFYAHLFGPVRWSETWLKLTENIVSVELLWEKNTVSAEKRSRISRIWGKPE